MKIKTYEVANKAQKVISTVLDYGDLKGKEGWEEKSAWSHVERAIQHLQNCRSDAPAPPHLAHALTRIAMAIALKDHCSDSEQEGAE